MAGKRKRGANFTVQEREAFVQLIWMYKEPILNRRTDSASNEAKAHAWAALTHAHNQATPFCRTKESLIKLWEKVKHEAKQYKAKRGNSGAGADRDPLLEAACRVMEAEEGSRDGARGGQLSNSRPPARSGQLVTSGQLGNSGPPAWSGQLATSGQLVKAVQSAIIREPVMNRKHVSSGQLLKIGQPGSSAKPGSVGETFRNGESDGNGELARRAERASSSQRTPPVVSEQIFIYDITARDDGSPIRVKVEPMSAEELCQNVPLSLPGAQATSGPWESTGQKRAGKRRSEGVSSGEPGGGGGGAVLEVLKRKLLQQELDFKKKMYQVQLQTALTELEIKKEMYKKVKSKRTLHNVENKYNVLSSVFKFLHSISDNRYGE